MLDPNDRHVYLDALKPPDGYQFGEAIATTYSLDLQVLLTVPVALALPHLDPTKLTPEHAIHLHQALKTVASKLTIFCDATNVAAPAQNPLYAMLEDVLVQVRAPHGGAFHAKLWLIHFDPLPDEQLDPLLRLVVLSRNLTDDRSWDVSVLLEGLAKGRRRKLNNPLVQLLSRLPSLAVQPLAAQAQERLNSLSERVANAEWDLPEGFADLQFHVLGIGSKPKRWLPESSDRLAVISPFVMTGALAELLKSTSEPVALVSRAEELERCDPDTLRQFDAVYVMAANTDLDDAEDPEEVARGSNSRSGLHAKVLAAKRGWNTHLYLGSANATSSALLTGVNVEIMVELAGRTSAVPGKGIEGLLSTDGFGALLQAYEPPTTPQAPDPQQEHAERAIAEAACALMQAGLILRFTADAESYAPTLHSPAPLPLTGIASARTWLITTDISSARPLEPLGRGEPVRLAATPSAAATSLVAFELIAEAAPSISKQLVLKLPVLGMPADRDAQIVRTIVNNKERLIQYILSLLKVLDPFVRAGLGDDRGASGWATRGIPQGAGLLERLVRTKARHPERLTDVHAVLRDLTATAEGRDIVPPELLRVWQIITGETLE